MKDLAADRIRNVCLMAHGGAGKTTLAEAMLYNTGVLEKRKSSISTSICPCQWKDHKINVIDTPGYFDFVGEVKQGIRVVGTEKAWARARERKIPVIFFVNKMELAAAFGKFQIPIVENSKFTGYVEKSLIKINWLIQIFLPN